MPQSLSQMHIHLVFSTKHRKSLIDEGVRESLHAYMATSLLNHKCHPLILNSVEDHIHILFDLARTMSVSEAVEHLKSSSSKWMKTQGRTYEDFAWQRGYRAFTVSTAHLDVVRGYIANQREHHRVRTFQEEFREILRKHGIEFDERYVWD